MLTSRLPVLLAIIGVLTMSAVTASAAQAEEPYWKVNGTRLSKGEVRKFTMGTTESYVLRGTWLSSEIAIKCGEAVVESGAVIIGSAPGHTATDEATTALRHCSKTEVLFECWIDAEEIIFHKSESHLVSFSDGLTQLVGEVYLPTKTTNVVTNIKALGKGCPIETPEANIEGTYAGEFMVNEEGIAVGKEVEALSPEVVFPKEQIKVVTLGGKELKIGLTLEGNPVTIEGRSTMELLSGEKFGGWTK